MPKPPVYIDLPGIGKAQCWSRSDVDAQHWYVTSDQKLYRVNFFKGLPASYSLATGDTYMDGRGKVRQKTYPLGVDTVYTAA